MPDNPHSDPCFDRDPVEDENSATYPPAPILLVDDEPDILESLELALLSHGMDNVITVSNSSEVEEILRSRRFELLVLDLMMAKPSGEEILMWVRDQYSQLPVIVVTGNVDAATAVRCMQLGASDYLIKPVDRTRYISSIRKVIETQGLRRSSLNRIASDVDSANTVTYGEFSQLEQSRKAADGTWRQEATVVLSDICGYTAMFQYLTPEDVYKVVSTIKLNTVSIVKALGGVVNQFVGDEVVSIFGVPESPYNSAIGSVAAALEIHSMVRDVVGGYSERFPVAFGMHSGIGTGQLIISSGSRLSGEYDISGTPINIAARLRDLAKSSEVIVDQQTARLIDGRFKIVEMGGVTMKGIPYVVAPSVVLTKW